MVKNKSLLLGRVVQHDPRSLSYAAPADTLVGSVLWKHYGPVLDQGRVGSCTGNATAQALNSQTLHVPRSKYMTEDAALKIYSRATELDGFAGTYPPDDTGSSGLAACKAAAEMGLVSRYEHAFGIDHMAAALQVGPVMLGTNWYESMFNPDDQGRVRVDGAVAGGHEYLCLGVNMRGRYFTCLNSWSSSWGRSGRFRISWADMDRLLREDGDVIQPRR